MAKRFFGDLVEIKDKLIQRNFNSIVDYLRFLETRLGVSNDIITEIKELHIPSHNSYAETDILGEVIGLTGTYKYTRDGEYYYPIGMGTDSLVVSGHPGVEVAFTVTSRSKIRVQSQALFSSNAYICRVVVTYRKK